MRPVVRVFDSLEALFPSAAHVVADAGREAMDRRSRFMLALAGGSTPRRLYRLLAGGQGRTDSIRWPDVHVFWGDERHVPPTDPDSNFRMAEEALLAHVPVRPEHVHRIAGEEPDAARAAEAYERTLRQAFAEGGGEVPSFDLLLLGMGADGHTASLFPGSPAIEDETRLVLAPWVETLGAHRITVTPRVLCAARSVVVLVTGAEKAPVLRDVLEGPTDPARLPIQCLRRAMGDVTWMIDAKAGRDLPAAR